MTDVLTLSMRVAEEIRVVMARKRVNQSELARRIGVSVPWVNDRLNGGTEIKLNDLPRVAAGLGVPVSQLLPEEIRTGGGQTPYSASLPDRPRGGRPPNRRNGPSGGPGRASGSEDTRRPVRRRNGPSMAPLPRAA